MNPVFADLPITVFEVMSQLARENAAINLGQGFPDDPGPEDVRRKAAEAVVDGWNQYPSMMGIPELRQAIAAHYRHWQGLDLDPEREVMVTSGATEALAGALLALIEPGDEVVLFQPMYDAYLPLVRRAGGMPRFVRLEPPHWRFDRGDAGGGLHAARPRSCCSTTRSIPSGTRLRPRGPRAAGALLPSSSTPSRSATRCGSTSMFDGRAPRAADRACPGMRERCVKIGSAGKIFSLTGWKVGFVCAAPPLLRVLAKAHQFITFTTPPNLQAAVAYGLGKTDDYFDDMRARLAAQPRPLRRRAARARLPGARRAGHLFPQRRPRAARAQRGRRDASASGSWSSTRSRRFRCRPSTRRIRSARSCASASPSATRRSTPRSSVSPARCGTPREPR